MDQKILKNNFYKAVNQKWLEETKIPGDKPAWGAFYELDKNVEETLMQDAKLWAEGEKELPNINLISEYVKFYKMCQDYEKRSEIGVKSALVHLKRIEEIKDLKDFNNKFVDFELDGYTLPVVFGVGQDFKDSSLQRLEMMGPDLILPEKSYYDDENTKTQLLNIYKDVAIKLLEKYGYTNEQATKHAENTIKFDSLLVPFSISAVEAADYTKLYNLLDFKKEVGTKSKHLNLVEIGNKLVNNKVEHIIVPYLPFLEGIDKLVNPENLELIKSWMLLSSAFSLSKFLSDEIRILAGTFGRALSGIKEPSKKEKAAYQLANSFYGMIVGKYYGLTYFGPTARKDVHDMVVKMIDIYKERLTKNTWLSDETRHRAIAKLSKLGIHVGYPDKLEPYYDKFIVKTYEEGGDLVTNAARFVRIKIEYSYSRYMQPVDPEIWGMSPAMVNAYYHPFFNHIVFPAAILQRPFYSLKQTSSENYGGIGAVMAHEISHAFDNNGAKFDEFGNLNNWWKEEDLKNFEKYTKQMIELFEGAETDHGKCNGTLTVSENIADCGGFQCALAAAQLSKDFDAHKFFENWAKIWRQVQSPQYAKILLTADVHAPAMLRANLQLKNVDLFHETYKTTEEDEMYLVPEKRITIW